MGISSPLVTSLDPTTITPGTKTGARSKATTAGSTRTDPFARKPTAGQASTLVTLPNPSEQRIPRKSVPTAAPSSPSPAQPKPLSPRGTLPWLQDPRYGDDNSSPTALAPDGSLATPATPLSQDGRRVLFGGRGSQLRGRGLQLDGRQPWSERNGQHRPNDGFSGRLQRLPEPAAGNEIREANRAASDELQETNAQEIPRQVAIYSQQVGQDQDGHRADRQQTQAQPSSSGAAFNSSTRRQQTNLNPTGGDGTPSSGGGGSRPGSNVGSPSTARRRPTIDSRSENEDVRSHSAIPDEDNGRGQPSTRTSSRMAYWRSPRTNQALPILPVAVEKLIGGTSPRGDTSTNIGEPVPRPSVDPAFDGLGSKLTGETVGRQAKDFEDESQPILQPIGISPRSEEVDTQGCIKPSRVSSRGLSASVDAIGKEAKDSEDQGKPILEEVGLPARPEDVAKQGYFQPGRIGSPGLGARARDVLKNVATKAVAGIEELDTDTLADAVQRAELDKAAYWQTKRTRSPDAWHQLCEVAAAASKDLSRIEGDFVEPVVEALKLPEPAVDPANLTYWHSKRCVDPQEFWDRPSNVSLAVAKDELIALKDTVLPVQEILQTAENAVNPATITYQKSRRVWEPESYWRDNAALTKQAETGPTATTIGFVPRLLTRSAEDLVESPPVNPPQASYWQSGRTRAQQPQRLIEPMSSIPKTLLTVTEHSPSEYSGDVSDYPQVSPSRSRKSLSESSGRRRPTAAGFDPTKLPYLWHASRQLVSTSTDVGDAEHGHRSKQLSKATEGLNALMDDAITMAVDAARNGRPEEVADIFKYASRTMRRASTMRLFSPSRRSVARKSSSTDSDVYPGSENELPRQTQKLPSAGIVVKDTSRARTTQTRARGRSDSVANGNYLGLPATIRSDGMRPLVTKVSTLSGRRRSTQLISPAACMVQQDATIADFTMSSSSQSNKDGTTTASGSAAQFDLLHPRRRHISLQEGQGFSLGRHHVRPPTAREWQTGRKRITAAIACLNTIFIGLMAGIYAGEVPRIQYQIADTKHVVIYGNVVLFMGVGVSTLIFWPLPLLHGRKPYTLAAFALMLPLQIPQALAIQGYRDPRSLLVRFGLLLPRILTGIAMGFANINLLPTLLDLFGASLQSERPHQELVVEDDVRRQGGGIGLWLGIWSWCYIGSLSVGFCIGACIISTLDPAWGFYLIIILLSFFLFINVVAPETRPSPYCRSLVQFFDADEKIVRRVARGEVKLHISNDGPKWWFEEVWAGIVLTKRMVSQPGFALAALYLAWIYAQVVLEIILLGALLSRDYTWKSYQVGLASLSLAFGALLAIPLTHANWFSRSRFSRPRTDSMTFHHARYVWTSHMLRRCIFTLTLPLALLAYTIASPGTSVSAGVPIAFVGLVGFLSNLAITECVGIIMETFDTSDLQPGANSKHRRNSLPQAEKRRRTNYSSFPRVCAGFFAAQSSGFFLAAVATGVSGKLTRALGAQICTAIAAGILLVLTVLMLGVLWRWKSVQVVPDGVIASVRDDSSNSTALTGSGMAPGAVGDWKPVLIGHPSGKMRRMNLLEIGKWSRWGEIRRLNKLE